MKKMRQNPKLPENHLITKLVSEKIKKRPQGLFENVPQAGVEPARPLLATGF